MDFLLHGSAATHADIESDAKKWDVHFAPDVFHDLRTNHEHDCTKTCSKISQPKLKLNCASTKCPHPVPVFDFMTGSNLKCQKKGRQGKPAGAPAAHRGRRRWTQTVSIPAEKKKAASQDCRQCRSSDSAFHVGQQRQPWLTTDSSARQPVLSPGVNGRAPQSSGNVFSVSTDPCPTTIRISTYRIFVHF